MEERQVSVDGQPRPLPDPFVVAATQNPIEYEGTYPLPEAQLDRFLLKLSVPLPDRDAEYGVLARHMAGFDPRDLAAAGLRQVASADDLARAPRRRGPSARRPRGDGLRRGPGRATRTSPSAQLGVSPRGAIALLRAARAWAWLAGRDYVTPDDVKALARPALRHRISVRPEAELEGVTAEVIIDCGAGLRAGPALMVLTGRAALLALLGAAAVGLLVLVGVPAAASLLAVNAAIVAALVGRRRPGRITDRRLR